MNSVKVDATPQAAPAKKGIGLFDGIVFVLSCTIGSGLFFAPAESATAANDPWLSLMAWLIAGILSLAGSLVYSELGTSLVSASAESYYLDKAFGPAVSFTFSWTMTTIIGSSACACISWVLGQYCAAIFQSQDSNLIFFVAIGVLVFLCIVNLVSPNYILMLNRFNVICKVLAVAIVVIGGLVSFAGGFNDAPYIKEEPFAKANWGQFCNAVMCACFALSGWNMLNPLSEEMKNPAKDVPKIYSLGMISTMILALLVNAAFYACLSTDYLIIIKGVPSKSLATGMSKVLFYGEFASNMFRIVLCILICFCCLGSCNGIMMGTSKCIASNGREGVLPRNFGATSKKHDVPFVSVVFFTIWTSILVVILRLNNPLSALMFVVTLYTVGQWGFFVLVGLALFVLRYKFPNLERPYKIHMYPVFPAFFVLAAGAIVLMTFIGENWGAAISSAVIILLGVALYYASTVDFFRKIYFKVSSYIPDFVQDESGRSVEMTKTKNAPLEG